MTTKPTHLPTGCALSCVAKSLTLLAGFCLGTSMLPADNVTLYPESSPAINGPWAPVDPAKIQATASGAMMVTTDAEKDFFRLRIENGGDPKDGGPIKLAEAPLKARSIALDHLQVFSTDADGDKSDQIWDNAKLGPIVYPIFDPAAADDAGPAYVEFKVVRANKELPPAGFLTHGPVDPSDDLGYILVSLNRSDFPIAGFASRGKTPVEQLHRLAGTPDVKVKRFGSTLLVAEDASGKLLANWGAQPFKPGPQLLVETNRSATWSGDTDDQTDMRPKLAKFTAEPYGTYADLKADYVSNPVYVHLRNRKAKAAAEQWDAEEGIRHPVITVLADSLVVIHTNDTVLEFRLDTELNNFARIQIGSGGKSLRIGGIGVGSGVLHVRTPTQEYTYSLEVIPRSGRRSVALAGPFKPGWQKPYVAKAGDYGMQPKYDQLFSSDFCPYVGCGPNAWGILFAWFERNRGVKAAFGKVFEADAPAESGWAFNDAIFPTMSELHELCDVICGNGPGATLPGDMAEGGIEYTAIRAFSFVLKRSWNMHWTIWDDCPEDGAWACRDAIKKGYPGVVGLGWLWHYAVAFTYKYQEYKFTSGGPVIFTRRFLECNMGWGPDHNTSWYNFCDTFFAADMKLANGPLAK